MYRKLFSDVTEVEALDGTVVKCNYLQHKRYSKDCGFCVGLHYVFVRFSEERSYSKVYELRTAINIVLEYVEIYENRNPKELRVDSFLKFTSEHLYGLHNYVLKNGYQKDLASRLKGAINTVALEFEDELPILTLPKIITSRNKSREPLDDIAYNQLETSLKIHVDHMYEKLAFREEVEKSVAYEYSDIVNEYGDNIFLWKPCEKRVLKTMIVAGHPFSIDLMEFKEVWDRRGVDNRSIVELIYDRYTNCKRNSRASPYIPLMEDVLKLYYPTALDQAALVISILFQTGWNKEAVISLDINNYEHVLTGLMNSETVLMVSEKNKSQHGKPYKTPKPIMAHSNKSDKYSAWNAIELAKKLSEPLQNLSLEVKCKNRYGLNNPIFMCMRNWNVWLQKPRLSEEYTGRFSSIKHKEIWEIGVKRFFEAYEIRDRGNRLTNASHLNGRLRPTWILHTKENKNHPLSLISYQAGHTSIDTTDIYYDSSAIAIKNRKEKLKNELEAIVTLLRKRQFKGIIAKNGKVPKKKDVTRVFTMPYLEKIIWICINPYKPSWIGNEELHSSGRKCNELHKCLFCSQICIVEDSLPFLMKRQSILQSEIESIGNLRINKGLIDELNIIDYILTEWRDDSALQKATRYLRQNSNILPHNMNSLSVFFED